ncbi:MAG TPA: sugar phosphate isomerase/epimerase family protein [Trebonia sp.]|nr:sugar phosphate isomerase/epimerase family protein [Trebonia sp.]
MSASRDVYLSFFMFTVNLQPGNTEYTKVIVRHMRELRGLGYKGFDLPIFPGPIGDHQAELAAYTELKRALDQAGLDDLGFTTNVASAAMFDPTLADPAQREVALAYLKSRIDITAILGGESVMAGPIIFPYNVFPVSGDGQPIWSDALQDWARPGYANAQPVLEQAGQYAQSKRVKLAIEPVDHWEQAAPNMIGDVLAFLEGVPCPQVGVVCDIAHVVLGSSGPGAFRQQIRQVAEAGRLNYVQVSSPDRGKIRDSWIPWDIFLPEVLPRYQGPLLIEIFNAIPAFLTPLHQTRRKFWIPGEDEPVPGVPDAYTMAGESLEALAEELSKYP